jgi:hypothetical protein
MCVSTTELANFSFISLLPNCVLRVGVEIKLGLCAVCYVGNGKTGLRRSNGNGIGVDCVG